LSQPDSKISLASDIKAARAILSIAVLGLFLLPLGLGLANVPRRLIAFASNAWLLVVLAAVLYSSSRACPVCGKAFFFRPFAFSNPCGTRCAHCDHIVD